MTAPMPTLSQVRKAYRETGLTPAICDMGKEGYSSACVLGALYAHAGRPWGCIGYDWSDNRWGQHNLELFMAGFDGRLIFKHREPWFRLGQRMRKEFVK